MSFYDLNILYNKNKNLEDIICESVKCIVLSTNSFPLKINWLYHFKVGYDKICLNHIVEGRPTKEDVINNK